MRRIKLYLIGSAMSSKIILIMGLSGSGKTTLALKLQKSLQSAYFNADKVRGSFEDWDFSTKGRIRQATRMRRLAANSISNYVILDFICPTKDTRSIIKADFIIWMDTVSSSCYVDTDKLFTIPTKIDLIIKDYENVDINEIRSKIASN